MSPSTSPTRPNRLTFFLAATLASGLVAAVLAAGPAARHRQPPAQAPVFDLDEATFPVLQARMASGKDSARSLAEKYLSRIEAIDRNGPALHAVIEVNPDALGIADQMDSERRQGRVRGPLHGVPVVIKDNVATGDRMLTTAGSLALAGGPAPKDAFLVERLRTAGAVILGKTNLSEWANFRSTHSSSGWSARGGQTRNPYALDRNPSGSSSGSAVAVSANLAAAAIGTETDGSIVSPSSNNALVGIKPTVGLVSRSGIVPIAPSQDTAGPMARTVADAAALLSAVSGHDPADDATTASPSPTIDYTSFLRRDGLAGARLGIVRNRLFGNHAATDRLAETAIADLKAQGAVIVDPAIIPTLGQFDESEFEVLLFEFKESLNRFLLWFGPHAAVRSLRDLIAFNQAQATDELRHFGQEIFLMADTKSGLTSNDYKLALERNRRLARTEGIDAVMKRFNLDALVAPTGGPAWLTDLVNGDSSMSPSPSTIAAVAGYPHVTVPMGSYRGLPIGLSFFGRAWSEPTLLRIAYAYEQATRHRQPPRFAPSADLSEP
ncbi:MAG: amidase [Acidobacteria bacterium]|nr:MAG: amidase [Acidobacteriota bacterium]PYR46983.1 MAG: amidase [Acidobacteriota bacterium]